MANNKKKERKRYTARSARDSQRRGQVVRRALITIIILAVVAATVFFLVLRNQSQISIAENAIGSLLTPVQSAFSSAANSVKTFFTNWRNYDDLQDEYDALYRENQQLSLELDSAEEAMLENDRLKTLLNAKSSYESLDPIYARVIARDAGQWFCTFSINRGTMHDISTGMAVVNGDGLIGYVYQVGLNYANVLSIIDARSGLSCLVQRTRDNGIMRGGVTNESDTAECYIYYLPNVNNIMPGDLIVTSGTDNLYPKGLTVGTVTQVSLAAGSEGNYAVVSPAVDFLHIEEVLVLREVVEKASDLTAVPTATPAPTATPSPTPDSNDVQVMPNTTEEIFTYPSPGQTGSADAAPSDPAQIQNLPEDRWVDD
ncbi:MAG: rod shape-determining protein MreC [Candidatus Faecivicinus sp.]